MNPSNVRLKVADRGPQAMSDKPRRAWFQLHLSTAIVLMFVASIVAGLNLSYREEYWTLGSQGRLMTIADINVLVRRNENPNNQEIIEEFSRNRYYGWPFEIFDHEVVQIFNPSGEVVGIESERFYRCGENFGVLLTCDVLVALAMLLMAVVISERLLRRREARAP